MFKISPILFFTFVIYFTSAIAFAVSPNGTVIYVSYATTNATTSAYTTLTAATNQPFSTFFVCDTSTHFVKLATGAAGQEIDLIGLPINGCFEIETGRIIPAGTRISFKALDATANTGGLMLSLSR